MIMVASPSKPFTYNIKGYPRRTIILKDYHDDIEALYAQIEQSAQSDVVAPVNWDIESTRVFVRTVVQRVVKRSLSDDADLFRNGCDRCDFLSLVFRPALISCLSLAYKQLGSGTRSFAQSASTPQLQLDVCT